MAFEIWDTESGNLVGDYPTERAALDVVRRMIEIHGRQAVATWALANENRRGTTRTVAAGTVLVDRALESIPA